jgi:hypothetical protein
VFHLLDLAQFETERKLEMAEDILKGGEPAKAGKKKSKKAAPKKAAPKKAAPKKAVKKQAAKKK